MRTGHSYRPLILVFVRLAAFAALVTPAAADVEWAPPRVKHPSHSDRVAIVLISASETSSGMSAAKSSAAVYARRLRELGFQTATIGGVSRPEFDKTLREAASQIPARSEIAMVVVGSTISSGNDLFVVPADAVGFPFTDGTAIETEALRLSSIRRRIYERSPHDLVTLIEDCTEGLGACSSQALDAEPSASAIALQRGASQAARDVVFDAMTRSGAVYGQFYASVAAKLQPLGVRTDRSGALSPTFRFVPDGFFESLPNDCLDVDPLADDVSALNPKVADGVAACTESVTTWPYVFAYKVRLDAGREQLAYQKSVASCDGGDAATAYARSYPNARYSAAIDRWRQACDRRVKAEPKPELELEPRPEKARPRLAEVILNPAPAHVSPSFSCARARAPAERAICGSSQLASLDLQMTRVYGRAVGGLSGGARQSVVAAQRLWLQQRDQCGSSASCIARAYSQRISELR